ncbi:RNA pseudouridine synthase 4, mitochondrial [Selaginella moellendorffii]|uniref:RNA pseudouridine synthase 4, mitochondrial n=1 Tax=Selaginella moellendorffii TaxID=88036 RepID=UPI000D1C2671|nr:RNA pseudouridine synthase 4, mitochondrial [Selaginella moellendorffii]|eukprot:XP_024515469.1 RNA pseudouridine synthase 4, mitochondrial [Selaginella moellendorffii]
MLRALAKNATMRRHFLGNPQLPQVSRLCSTDSLSSSSGDEEEDNPGIGAWLKTLPPVPRREIGSEGQTIKTSACKWVSKCLPELPISTLSRLFRRRAIRVKMLVEDPGSGTTSTKYRRVKRNAIMPVGALICVPDSVTKIEASSQSHEPDDPTEEEIEQLKDAVLYKDEDLIVLNKPPGLPVQGGSKVERSLVSMMSLALQFEYKEPPRLVHRLDKDVSGVMILGRTYESTVKIQSFLCSKDNLMPSGSVGKGLDRKYIALVIGSPTADKGFISAPLLKMVLEDGKSDRVLIAADPKSENAIPAITEYQVLKRSVLGCTWLQLRPLTGRKHQLRVHCAQGLGLPIVGDMKYGFNTHKKWMAERNMNTVDPQDIKARNKMAGSVVSKNPLLHLHSRELTIPRLRKKPGAVDFGLDPERMRFVAPLPTHMESSWEAKPYVKKRPEKVAGWGWTVPKRVLRLQHMNWQKSNRNIYRR